MGHEIMTALQRAIGLLGIQAGGIEAHAGADSQTVNS